MRSDASSSIGTFNAGTFYICKISPEPRTVSGTVGEVSANISLVDILTLASSPCLVIKISISLCSFMRIVSMNVHERSLWLHLQTQVCARTQ